MIKKAVKTDKIHKRCVLFPVRWFIRHHDVKGTSRVDIKSNSSPEYHVRRILREAKYIFQNVKLTFKYRGSERFRTCVRHVRHKLEYVAAYWSLHLRKQVELLEKT